MISADSAERIGSAAWQLAGLPDLTKLAESVLSAFASLFTQNARIVALELGPESSISPDWLLAHRVTAVEALSEPFCLMAECVSADSFIALTWLMGSSAQISVLLADGSERIISGIITRAEHLGSNGGMARYGLQIEPALVALKQRRNSRTFQDKNTLEIVQTILQEHIDGNPVFTRTFAVENKTGKEYPPRSYCQQYRETDYDFITRILREDGISYTWSFEAGSATDGTSARHTMVLFDSNDALEQNEQGVIRYHRDGGGTEPEDVITEWLGARKLQSAFSTLASYDYKGTFTHLADHGSGVDQGEHSNGLSSTLEDYDPQTLYYAAGSDALKEYARMRQQAKDLIAKIHTGYGTVRSMTPGTWFRLANHPVENQDLPEAREKMVLSVAWCAENNLDQKAADIFHRLFPAACQAIALQAITAKAKLPQQTVGLVNELIGRAGNTSNGTPPFAPPGTAQPNPRRNSSAPYQSVFQAVRRDIPIVPSYTRDHAKPTAPGIQTATVVGPTAEEIYTDEYGRIKVQFHWQRPTDHPDGTANYDDKSSTWVRVAYPSAGAGWGHQHIPRVSQEVIIDFIEGDIDRPICTGVVYNGTHLPPTFSDAGSLPANKTLSGIKTKEYKGYGYNELLFDDTTKQLRTKLSSEHGKTQLNQGFLIHPRTDGKGTPRGEGFELRTDDYGAIRAAKGMLISTNGRKGATSTHLDSKELAGQMQNHLDYSEALSNAAFKQNADSLKVNEVLDNLIKVAQAMYSQEGGGNKGNVPGYSEPILAFSSPAGIVYVTPKSQVLNAGQDIHSSSQRDTNIAVGRDMAEAIQNNWSVFVVEGDVKQYAAKGKFEIQAQDNNVEVSAAKKIILSAADEIILQAPKISFVADGAKIDLAGGSITEQCRATHTIKASDVKIVGPGDGKPVRPKFKRTERVKASQEVGLNQVTMEMLKDIAGSGPIKYKYIDPEHKEVLAAGTLGEDGIASRIFTEGAKNLHFEIEAGEKKWETFTDHHYFAEDDDAGDPSDGPHAMSFMDDNKSKKA